MANPTLEDNTLARRKPLGEAFNTKDTLLPTLPTGQHNTTPPNLADKDVAGFQMDDMGNIKVSFGDPAQAAAISGGMYIPAYNSMVIDESAAPDVTITYKLDGSTVATKTIVVVGTTTTITVTVV